MIVCVSGAQAVSTDLQGRQTNGRNMNHVKSDHSYTDEYYQCSTINQMPPKFSHVCVALPDWLTFVIRQLLLA